MYSPFRALPRVVRTDVFGVGALLTLCFGRLAYLLTAV